MFKRRTPLSILGALLVLGACQPAAETAEQAQARLTAEAASAKTAIEASNVQFMSHFNAGHGDSVAAFYTENGRVMAPNLPASTGRQAIAQSMALGAASPTLTLVTESVVANGGLAVELGTYKISLTPPGLKAPITDSGKYMVSWQKVGERWLMAADIWNSDLPGPPPPPAARP
jgi:ketosteroid isomerase-like protein